MTAQTRPAAVYRFFNAAGALLYVGVCNRIDERWSMHRAMKRWWAEVESKRIEWFPSRTEAEMAEALAINHEGPLYNIKIPALDGSGKSHIRTDAPAIAWEGNPSHRQKMKGRRQSR